MSKTRYCVSGNLKCDEAWICVTSGYHGIIWPVGDKFFEEVESIVVELFSMRCSACRCLESMILNGFVPGMIILKSGLIGNELTQKLDLVCKTTERNIDSVEHILASLKSKDSLLQYLKSGHSIQDETPFDESHLRKITETPIEEEKSFTATYFRRCCRIFAFLLLGNVVQATNENSVLGNRITGYYAQFVPFMSFEYFFGQFVNGLLQFYLKNYVSSIRFLKTALHIDNCFSQHYRTEDVLCFPFFTDFVNTVITEIEPLL